MIIKDSCLWPHLVQTVNNYPPLSQNTTTEVCIIGGGYTGLSTAIHLTEKGIHVCLLEANTVGHGGSGRNVGFVNAGAWMKPDEITQILGIQSGEKLNTLLGNAPQLVFDIIERFNIDAQVVKKGNLQLAHNASTEADIRERYQQWQSRGADVALLSKNECRETVGTDKIRLALLDKRSGTINPYAFITGLAKAAQNLGVSIFENSPVCSLRQLTESGKPQWKIETSNGQSVTAAKVILASNAYTKGEWSELTRTFFQVNYYQIASEPLQGEIADAILPKGHGSADTRTVLSSFRRDKEGRLLLGTVGSHLGKPSWFMPAWANRVTQFYFPKLPKVNWQYQWTGKFGFTNDHLFRVFEPAQGLLAATAFNGRGITTGTLLGKAFADYLMSHNSDDLPIPITTLKQNKVRFKTTKSLYYETGVTLYHAGQCLHIII